VLPPVASPHSSSLLIIGHPGHELRVWGWLTAARPFVCILTDGSGSTGHPRLALSRAALEEAGALPASPFGELTDEDVYAALTSGEYGALLTVAHRLTTAILTRKVTLVACDAIEGYNPTQDVCGLLARAAVDVASVQGPAVTALEFAVSDVAPVDAVRSATIRHELSESTLADKVALARSYARAAGPMLEEEVNALLARHGTDPFRTETLEPVSRLSLAQQFADAVPFYETHGEQRVREGKYTRVLRLRDHLLPFEEALADWVKAAS
jgi:hypothetical protein